MKQQRFFISLAMAQSHMNHCVDCGWCASIEPVTDGDVIKRYGTQWCVSYWR